MIKRKKNEGGYTWVNITFVISSVLCLKRLKKNLDCYVKKIYEYVMYDIDSELADCTGTFSAVSWTAARSLGRVDTRFRLHCEPLYVYSTVCLFYE